MREEQTDLWAARGLPDHFIGISTNGFVKRNGEAVMGRGCAAQAARIYPSAPRLLGQHIKRNGNVPGWIGEDNDWALIVLPVKHSWWEQADLGLIQMSVVWLREYAENNGIVTTIHVPRLGCGNGRLDWATQVLPLMRHLPDNVLVHS
jgi:hypothetical protein